MNIIGKALKLRDGTITTTNALFNELIYYVTNVYINHNVESDEMWKLSEKDIN